jgi:K+-sensing histidine kinase KdpD
MLHEFLAKNRQLLITRCKAKVAGRTAGLPHDKAGELSRTFGHGAAEGAGLSGLSIVQRSVEATGGDMRVLDRPGTGCVFTIEAPLRSIQRREKAKPKKTAGFAARLRRE